MKRTIVKTVLLSALAVGICTAQEPPEPPEPPIPPNPAFAPVAPLPPIPMDASMMMAWQQVAPPAPPAPPAALSREYARDDARAAAARGVRSARDSYGRGQSALDKRSYDRAIDEFNHVIEAKADRADGALYWRAYCENKLGRRSDALTTLGTLAKTYPSSRWIEDARALEVEVQQSSGSKVAPDAPGDEETKLLILNSMGNSDPERTVPALENLLKSNNSPRVKERALFVLAQLRSQRARDVIARMAKGGGNPDLQSKAIEYLAVFGGHEGAPALADIYKGTSDSTVKRSVLHAFMINGAREQVLTVAKTETNQELRLEAIRQLGIMGGYADLLQLYSPDASPEVKRAVIEGLFIGGQTDKIAEIARGDKDPAMRREAIHKLGIMGRKGADILGPMYAKETDPNAKRAMIEAMFIQQNANGLIDAAKSEKDPGLRAEAIRRLALIHTKEAQDFLIDMLSR